MKKFLSTALIPFLIGSFSFSLNSCKTNDKWTKELKDEASFVDKGIKFLDGSNFEFKKNKKERYFILSRDALCYPEFEGYGSTLWDWGTKVQMHVPDDKIWDRVASYYHFKRNDSKETIKEKMQKEMKFHVRVKAVVDIKKDPSKCVVTYFETLY